MDWRRLVREQWDVLLVLVVALFLFLYNLKGWRVMTVEEWQFYRDFTTNWFASTRIHSFFIPSYVMVWPVPSRDFLVLRQYMALLSVAGVGIYHLAVRRFADSRYVALVASALLVTDAWMLWYGRHFLWTWAAITVSALMFYLVARWGVKSLAGTSVLGGISILNLSQSVFFVFPFIAAQLGQFRSGVTRQRLLIAAILLAVITAPSLQVFLERQTPHLRLQEGPDYQVNEFVRFPVEYNIAGVGRGTVTIVLDPFNAFKQVTWRIGIPAAGLYNFEWSPTEQLLYRALGGLILVFPFLLYWRDDWEYRMFFAGGTVLVFLTLVVFPFLTDETYLWGFALFLYPCLAYGAVKAESRRIRMLAVLLAASLVVTQGITAHRFVLTFNYTDHFDQEIGEKIAGERIAVTHRAERMIYHSQMDLLAPAQNYTVIPCSHISQSPRMKLTSDACSIDSELLGNPRWLKLYR